MNIIRKWSYKSAYYITQQMKESHQHRSVLYYGFQMLFGETLKIILIIALSIIFDAFLPTILMLAVFWLSRSFAGGYHMDTNSRCTVTTLAIFALAILIAKYSVSLIFLPNIINNENISINVMNIMLTTITIFILLAFIYCMRAAVKFAPRDHPNKPIIDPSRRKRLKRLAIAFNIIWASAAAILLYSSSLSGSVSGNMSNLSGAAYDYQLIMSACLGALIAYFSITPSGFRFFDIIAGKSY